MMAKRPISYAVLRGKVIETDLIEFGGRGGDITFLAPDPHKIVDQIPLASPRLMEDLYSVSFDQILDYLAELVPRLDLKGNPYLQEALAYSYDTAPTTRPIMDAFYHDLPFMFDRERIRKMVEDAVGFHARFEFQRVPDVPRTARGKRERSCPRTNVRVSPRARSATTVTTSRARLSPVVSMSRKAACCQNSS